MDALDSQGNMRLSEIAFGLGVKNALTGNREDADCFFGLAMVSTGLDPRLPYFGNRKIKRLGYILVGEFSEPTRFHSPRIAHRL